MKLLTEVSQSPSKAVSRWTPKNEWRNWNADLLRNLPKVTQLCFYHHGYNYLVEPQKGVCSFFFTVSCVEDVKTSPSVLSWSTRHTSLLPRTRQGPETQTIQPSNGRVFSNQRSPPLVVRTPFLTLFFESLNPIALGPDFKTPRSHSSANLRNVYWEQLCSREVTGLNRLCLRPPRGQSGGSVGAGEGDPYKVQFPRQDNCPEACRDLLCVLRHKEAGRRARWCCHGNCVWTKAGFHCWQEGIILRRRTEWGSKDKLPIFKGGLDMLHTNCWQTFRNFL